MKGLMDLYVRVRDRLRPTPAHAHYVFTLHELARVVQGILLMSPRSKIKPKRKGRALLVTHRLSVSFTDLCVTPHLIFKDVCTNISMRDI